MFAFVAILAQLIEGVWEKIVWDIYRSTSDVIF